MLITPKKRPIDILDTLQNEIFSTPKRPLRDLNSPDDSSASSPQIWSPQSSVLSSPEKVATFSTVSFYKPKNEYLNPLERKVVGKPKIYLPARQEKQKTIKIKSKKSYISSSAFSGKKKKLQKPASRKSTKENVPKKSTVKTDIKDSKPPPISTTLVCSPTKQHSSPGVCKSPAKMSNPVKPTKQNSPQKNFTKQNSPQNTPTKQNSPQKTLTKQNSPQNTPTKRSSPQKTLTKQKSPQNTPTKRSSPQKTLTKQKSPHNTPTKRSSPQKTPTKRSPGKTPSPRTRSSPRRKFFVTRSPSYSGKRWLNNAYRRVSFTLDFKSNKNSKRTSPNARKSPELKNSPKNMSPLNKQRKLRSSVTVTSPVADIDKNISNKNREIENGIDTASSSSRKLENSEETKSSTECLASPDVFEGESIMNNSIILLNVEPDTTPKKCYPIFSPAERSKNDHSSSKVQRLPVRSSPRRSRSKRFLKCSGSDQMVIDAGQRKLGAQQCTMCSMVYSCGEAQDEVMHTKFHDEFFGAVKYSGWKKERVVGKYMDGRVVMVLPSDPNYMHRKVHDVRKIVDRELGYSSAEASPNQHSAFLMYISDSGRIIGFLFAESISIAFRVLRSCDVPCSPLKTIQGWYCSTEPTKALCGINRIWTDTTFRRHRIATRLVDCLKGHFIYGQVLSTDEIAFSDPTEAGRSFATKYTGTETFLVYK